MPGGKRFDICYLHIGAEKTGSSTIQRFLHLNRTRLLEEGVLFPATIGTENHTPLAAYAQAGMRERNFLRGTFGIEDEAALRQFQKATEDALRAEVAAAPAQARILMLSSEHCHTRVASAADVARLGALLGDLAQEVRVVFYIRRQDRVAVSIFSTALKVGFPQREVNLMFGPDAVRFNYWNVCRLYGDAFGDSALAVRRYHRSSFAGGGLISDFCTAVSLPGHVAWQTPVRKNTSLSVDAQRLLAEVNTWPGGPLAPGGNMRKALTDALDDRCTGPGARPAESDARRFLAQYDKSNETLRNRYFPESEAPLFDMEFNGYPEAPTELGMDGAEMIAFAEASFPYRDRLLDAIRSGVAAYMP